MQRIILAPLSACPFKHTSCSTSSLPLLPPALSSTHYAARHLCPFFRRRFQAHIMQYPCTCKHTSCSTSPCAPPPLTHQSTHHAAHRLVPPFLPRLNIQADIMQHSHVVPPLDIHAHIMQHIICSPSFTCPFNHTSCSTSSMPLLLLAHSSTHHAAHHDIPPSPHETHHLVPPFAYPTHIMQHLSLCPS